MGWLFAVALGLHRGSERVVLQALAPIALGHALAIGAVIAGVVALQRAVELSVLSIICGIALIGWAAWHALYGHRHRVRVGMQTGLMGLAAWSFLMATAHGAGLMLIPALMPLSAAHKHSHGLLSSTPWIAAIAVGVHTAAMLAATGITAIVVYRWIGLAILKRAWINFEVLWTGMLIAAGALLILPALAWR